MKHPEGSAHSQAYTITSCLDLPGSRSSRRGLPNPHENRSSDRFSRKNIKVLQQMRMQNTFGDCRSVYYKFSRSAHLLSLLVALALVNIASCQTNTNPLVPEIDQPPNPQEEFSTVTVGCKLILLTALPPGAAFPLSWSRNGGLPSGATTRQNTTVAGSATTYYSALSFVVSASVNNKPITCNAVVPGNSGSASFNPSVILVPQEPQVTGPTTVQAGQLSTWTCVSAGASVVSPNVYWRNGQGNALITGVTHSAQITLDSYNNRQFTVTSVLNTALPPERAQYILRCILIHEYQGYSYTIEKPLQVTVLFPPQLRKQSGDIVLTTENVKQTISCIISASSPAATSVSWTKDGQPVDYSTGRYEVVSTSSPSLVISNVQKSDEGDYVCSVTNAEGTTSFETPTTLVVRYAPRISYSGGTSFQAALGASYTLPCPVDANPNATTIRWKRISATGETYINIQTEPRYTGSTAQATGLTINPVAATDQGNFACEADNDVGSGQGPTISLTVNSQPVITPPPASVTGSESVPVVLPCEITPLDGLQVLRWQKDGVNIVVSNSARYTGGTVLNPSLTILTPSDADSGSYRCVATNQYGTTAGGDFTLDIQYKPRLTVEDDPISTNPGPSVSLTCQVDANPAPNVLFWTKRGVGPIVSSGSNKYLGGTPANPTLTIINTDISDAGEYYCTVSNSQGTTESPAVDLNVITSPDVNIFPPSAVVEEGLQNLVLGCTVVASPPAQLVAWTKDGIVIDTASGTTTSGSGPKYAGGTTQSPSLTIFDVRRTDAGLYACVATNTEGVGTSPNLRVDVTYLPTLTVPSSSVVGGRESSITLTCGVEAFPPLISLRWVKDGSQDIDLTQQTTLGQNKYSGGTAAVPDLTIRDLNETIDTGVYRCVAENSRGSVTSDPVNVAVTFDPVVNVPTSVTSREGQTFTITCNVQMFPAANSLIWYKDNVEFDPAATPSKYQGGTLGVPSLTVLNPTGSDSGTYNCRASNNQGVDITSSDIPVAVIFSPKITTSTDLVTRDQGQSVTLDVTVEATPTPSRIQWQTSDIDGASSTRTDLNIGGRISGGTISNPSITITNAQPSDAAFYYIIVTNDEGSTTAGPIPFRVRYAPTNIEVTASPTTLQTGQSLTLTCSAEAWPEPSNYAWTIDEQDGTVQASGQVYTKAQVSVADWADFRCTVTNPVASRSASIRPNIQFAPVQTEPGVVLETVPIGSSVTLTCAVTANPLPTYVWYKGADIISGAVGSTYTLQVDEDTDFGSYSCSAQNIEGTLNPAVEFSVQEGEPDVGASVGSDDGLSTATIILIVIIVVIFLIIVILIIIFCCMQGTCAKLCKKDTGTAKVAPTTYNGQPTPPVYMNGGLVGTQAEPTTRVDLDDEPYMNGDKHYKPLNPGAIISVPERQGPRAHYLPPLTSENDNNIDSYYREEKRRSRRKRKHRKHRQADDKNALTGVEAAEGGEGGSPTPRTDGGETTPGRSSRSYGGAADDTYQN